MANIVDVSDVLLGLGIETPTEFERASAVSAIIDAEGAIRSHLRYDPRLGTRTEYYPQQDLQQFGPTMLDVSDSLAYERRLAGASSRELQLRHIPVRSITSLHIDYDGRAGTRAGAFGTDTLKTSGDDYWLNFDAVDDDGNGVCLDGIVRSQGIWPTSAGSVKIVYVSGYTAAEFRGQSSSVDGTGIWSAAKIEATRRLRRTLAMRKTAAAGVVGGAFTSERLGDYSYSVDGGTLKELVGSGQALTGESALLLSPYLNHGY